MTMIHVASSDLQSIGFENGVLYIKFNSGGLYQYPNVPASVYSDLMSASSKGSYFHAFIKNQYHGTRMN